MIKLKKNKKNLVIAVFVITLVFWGPMLYLLWNYFSSTNGNKMLLLFSFALLLIGIYFIYNETIKTPKVVLDDEKIIINKHIYYWKDLTDIDLWDTIGALGVRMDGIMLTFYLEKEIIDFFDSEYSNMPEAKAFLNQKIIDKKEQVEPYVFESYNVKEVENEVYETFKGNSLIPVSGILYWLLIIVFSCTALIFWHKELLWVTNLFSCFSLLFLFLFCRSANYILISRNYLIIKNTYFFWKKKIYKYPNIETIIMAQDMKELKIVSRNFSYKKVYIPNLRKDSYLLLKNRLIEQGVNVDYRLYY